jgi:very-short-patch-repair endonuclease
MKRDILPYNPKLKALARQLRQQMTLSEVLLWNHLKQGQMLGCDFDRQRPIGEFIVDFYCKDLKLAIEVDGMTHSYETAPAYDARRQARLEALGVRFLRFTDEDVKNRLYWVLEEIGAWIREHEGMGEQG